MRILRRAVRTYDLRLPGAGSKNHGGMKRDEGERERERSPAAETGFLRFEERNAIPRDAISGDCDPNSQITSLCHVG